MILLLLLIPILAALSFTLISKEATLAKASVIWSTLVGILTIIISYPALTYHVSQTGQLWQIGPFAAILILLIGFVQWTATLVSLPYLREELHEQLITFGQMRLYHILLQLFVLTMIMTLTANSIGLMWITLEGTTLATTLLVAFYGKKGSLEAAWKYIVICSVGISLGLIGVLLVSYAVANAHIGGNIDALRWDTLKTIAQQLSPTTMRWAFAFIFVGYGAKIGLVPLHTWLPDAHGRTPSPISGMLSGLLLNVAFFAVLRYKGLVDSVLGETWWTNRLFLFFGALSFIVPIAFILMQRNYKRLLAYSSIEHMGFIVFCAGLGPLGLLPMMIHVIGHSLTKSLLFFGTGNILLRWKSTKIENIGPVMTSLPYTGTLFLIGLLALLATPPSPLFFSEYLAFSAAILQYPFVAILLLVAGTLILAGTLRNLIPMLFSTTKDFIKKPIETWDISHTAMTFHVIALVILGIIFLNPSSHAYLQQIAASLY